jgi:DSF synthase
MEGKMQRSEVVRLDAPRAASYGRRKSQFESSFEAETGTLWGWFDPNGTPCFNLGLLNDIRGHDGALAVAKGRIAHNGEMRDVHYYVLGSRTPAVFNLGGDLALFVLLIKSREREALAHYAKLCVDNMYPRIRNFFCPTMTTISLVQGDALGGGFETVLSSDIVIAEESAQLGLPEILFNLFPGMGALSLLSRRIGMRAAEDLVTSGRIMSAAKLHEMGLVDILVKDGEGVAATRNWIAKNRKRRNGMQAIFAARQHVHPIERAELDHIAEVWVDAAMRLEDRDLKMMGRIVRAQMRRMDANTVVELPQEAISSGA